MFPMIIVAAAAAVASPEAARAPRPAGAASEWVTIRDYPAQALSARQEGAVSFSLDVDAAGAVSGCRVTQSSGAASLDGTTCALMFTRARFEAARDAGGKAVPGTYSSRVRWTYPSDAAPAAAPAPKPVELKTMSRDAMGKSVLWVNEDGIITDCDRAPNPYSNILPPPDICGLFPVGSRYGPPAQFKGRPTKRKITAELSIWDVNVR
jgi:protein TonB